MTDVDSMNHRFAVPGVDFQVGRGGLQKISISTDICCAEIYLHGAHITRWRPSGQQDILWMSQSSWFESGRPIRGGVPVCFPWFGAHPSEPSQPAHGWARVSVWTVDFIGITADGGIQVVMSLIRDDYHLRYRMEFSGRLSMSLEVSLSRQSRHQKLIETALHTYLYVGDVHCVTIEGLEQSGYLDKIDSAARKSATGEAIRFTGETDRVYIDTDAPCVLHDQKLGRQIRIDKSGSRSTVIWNPWIEKSIRMPDFGETEWQNMVCIETANAGPDSVLLNPGDTMSMNATISLI